MAIDPALMIFAAGFGTRMGELVSEKPKPLIKVSGKPLLEHAFELSKGISLSTIVLNVHYKHETLQKYLSKCDVTVLSELPMLLETGGGLKAALPILGANPVMTLNSDAVWLGANPLSILQKAWNPKKMDALLM